MYYIYYIFLLETHNIYVLLPNQKIKLVIDIIMKDKN